MEVRTAAREQMGGLIRSSPTTSVEIRLRPRPFGVHLRHNRPNPEEGPGKWEYHGAGTGEPDPERAVYKVSEAGDNRGSVRGSNRTDDHYHTMTDLFEERSGARLLAGFCSGLGVVLHSSVGTRGSESGEAARFPPSQVQELVVLHIFGAQNRLCAKYTYLSICDLFVEIIIAKYHCPGTGLITAPGHHFGQPFVAVKEPMEVRRKRTSVQVKDLPSEP